MAEPFGPAELRDMLTSSHVGELSFTTVPTMEPTQTLAAAAAAMRTTHHGSALVCEDGKLVGIVTERDLLRVLGAREDLDRPLYHVMTANPKAVAVDDSIFDVLQSMSQGGYRRLPVVDADGAPVGIVGVKAVTHFLVQHFPAAVYNQAAYAHRMARRREGA